MYFFLYYIVSGNAIYRESESIGQCHSSASWLVDENCCRWCHFRAQRESHGVNGGSHSFLACVQNYTLGHDNVGETVDKGVALNVQDQILSNLSEQ
jgi:hypothetical protein